MDAPNRIAISSDVTLQTLDEYLIPLSKNIGDTCYIDLSKASFITAPGGAVILLFLQYLKTKCKDIIILPPKNKNTLLFLSNIKFLTLAQHICDIDLASFPEPVDHARLSKSNILEIIYIYPNMTEFGYSDWLSRNTINTIVGKIDRLGSGKFENLSRVFLELTSNVFEHSKSFGYIAAQKIDHSKFKLFIGDLGIGLYKSLYGFYATNCENFERRFGPAWDEPKALDVAFVPGISSKRLIENLEEQQRGIGLYKALTIAKKSNGGIVCRSGTTKSFFGYRQNEWVTERKFNLDELPGTQLEVYLDSEDSNA